MRTLLIGCLACGLLAACGDDTVVSGATTTAAGGMGGGAVCVTDLEPSAEVAITDQGAIKGHPDGDAVAFLGIAYAKPPLGALRFAPPEPFGCFESVFDAAEFGLKCVQLDAMGNPAGAEDCLTLNVWTPAASTGSLPVMVFIHGGGNIQGSSRETLLGVTPLYTGRHLAEQGDVVVVTLNYRLGPFGFLPLPELVAEGDDGRAGNLGILDQIAALEWVARNVAAFGGDPDNVTIFGESAGGVNVCALVGSPLAAGLFDRAIVESGSCVSPARDDVIAAFSDRVDEGSCAGDDDRLACLRALDSKIVLEELGGSIGAFDADFSSAPGESYGPLVDGVVLPLSTDQAMIEGSHNAVPFMVGSNAEEMAGLIPLMVTTEQGYQDAISAAFMPFGQMWVDQVLATYPAASYPTPQHALNAVFGDLRFTCPTQYYASVADQGQDEAVFRYWFQRQAAAAMGPLPASHGIELLFVFGSFSDIPGFTPHPDDAALSAAMIGYWTRFAATGDPNGGSAPEWPTYDMATDPYIVLDAPISSGAQLKATECMMWEAFYDAVGG